MVRSANECKADGWQLCCFNADEFKHYARTLSARLLDTMVWHKFEPSLERELCEREKESGRDTYSSSRRVFSEDIIFLGTK